MFLMKVEPGGVCLLAEVCFLFSI